jgi:hypothetical protein
MTWLVLAGIVVAAVFVVVATLKSLIIICPRTGSPSSPDGDARRRKGRWPDTVRCRVAEPFGYPCSRGSIGST